MITEYRNWADKKITIQQTEGMDSYFEVLMDPSTNIIKQRKRIAKGIVEHIDYFKDVNESNTQIIDTLRNQANYFSISERESYGIYAIVYNKHYHSSDLSLISSRQLYNYSISRHYICNQRIDNTTNLPIDLDLTDKSYYEDDEYRGFGEKELFQCVYKEDGSLDFIRYMPGNEEQDFEYFTATNFNKLQAYFTDDISYYLNADFLP